MARRRKSAGSYGKKRSYKPKAYARPKSRSSGGRVQTVRLVLQTAPAATGTPVLSPADNRTLVMPGQPVVGRRARF